MQRGDAWREAPDPPGIDATFRRLFHQHPLIRAVESDGWLKPTRVSDLVPTSVWTSSGLYREFYREDKVIRQLAFALSLRSGVAVLVNINRSGRDFSQRDVEILSAVQSDFVKAYSLCRQTEQWKDRSAAIEWSRQGGANRAAVFMHEDGRVYWISPWSVDWLCRALDQTDSCGLTNSLREMAAGRDCEYRKKIRWRRSPAPGGTLWLEEKQLPECAQLTKREKEIAKWAALGKLNCEIAVILNISPRTVQKHLENVFRKLRLASRHDILGWDFSQVA